VPDACCLLPHEDEGVKEIRTRLNLLLSHFPRWETHIELFHSLDLISGY
jgi:hypothetical protein